ncbi:MAG TPA: hypothetical protein VFE32_10145 [Puia sp.]|nr:hypothetical protein [Puia sp.]
MRKVQIFFLAATVIGFFSLIGCTKNNNTVTKTPDSVYTSKWITLSMLPNYVDSDYEQKIVAPAITSAILNDGVIMGFGAYIDPTTQDTVEEAAIEFNMYQTFKVDTVLLQAGYDNSGLWYRYVVIPGSVLTTKGLTPAQAKSLNYAEVMKLVGSAAKKSESPTVQ